MPNSNLNSAHVLTV